MKSSKRGTSQKIHAFMSFARKKKTPNQIFKTSKKQYQDINEPCQDGNPNDGFPLFDNFKQDCAENRMDLEQIKDSNDGNVGDLFTTNNSSKNKINDEDEDATNTNLTRNFRPNSKVRIPFFRSYRPLDDGTQDLEQNKCDNRNSTNMSYDTTFINNLTGPNEAHYHQLIFQNQGVPDNLVIDTKTKSPNKPIIKGNAKEIRKDQHNNWPEEPKENTPPFQPQHFINRPEKNEHKSTRQKTKITVVSADINGGKPNSCNLSSNNTAEYAASSTRSRDKLNVNCNKVPFHTLSITSDKQKKIKDVIFSKRIKYEMHYREDNLIEKIQSQQIVLDEHSLVDTSASSLVETSVSSIDKDKSLDTTYSSNGPLMAYSNMNDDPCPCDEHSYCTIQENKDFPDKVSHNDNIHGSLEKEGKNSKSSDDSSIKNSHDSKKSEKSKSPSSIVDFVEIELSGRNDNDKLSTTKNKKEKDESCHNDAINESCTKLIFDTENQSKDIENSKYRESISNAKEYGTKNEGNDSQGNNKICSYSDEDFRRKNKACTKNKINEVCHGQVSEMNPTYSHIECRNVKGSKNMSQKHTQFSSPIEKHNLNECENDSKPSQYGNSNIIESQEVGKDGSNSFPDDNMPKNEHKTNEFDIECSNVNDYMEIEVINNVKCERIATTDPKPEDNENNMNNPKILFELNQVSTKKDERIRNKRNSSSRGFINPKMRDVLRTCSISDASTMSSKSHYSADQDTDFNDSHADDSESKSTLSDIGSDMGSESIELNSLDQTFYIDDIFCLEEPRITCRFPYHVGYDNANSICSRPDSVASDQNIGKYNHLGNKSDDQDKVDDEVINSNFSCFPLLGEEANSNNCDDTVEIEGDVGEKERKSPDRSCFDRKSLRKGENSDSGRRSQHECDDEPDDSKIKNDTFSCFPSLAGGDDNSINEPNSTLENNLTFESYEDEIEEEENHDSHNSGSLWYIPSAFGDDFFT